MKVTIMFRDNWFGGDGWRFYPITIEIGVNCPVCGGKRGEPKKHRFKECGEWFTVDTWVNPCGHIDDYKSCINEAEQLEKERGNDARINSDVQGKTGR